MLTKGQITRYGEEVYGRIQKTLNFMEYAEFHLEVENVCAKNNLGFMEQHLGISICSNDTGKAVIRFMFSYARECDLHIIDAICVMDCPEVVVVFPDLRTWISATRGRGNNIEWSRADFSQDFNSRAIEFFFINFYISGFGLDEPVIQIDHEAGGMLFVDSLLKRIVSYQEKHQDFAWRVGVTGFQINDKEVAIDSAKVIQMQNSGNVASLVICRDSSIHMSGFPVQGVFISVMTSWTKELGDLVFVVPEWRYCARLNRSGQGSDLVEVCSCDDPVTFNRFDGLSFDLSTLPSLFPGNASILRAKCAASD